VQKIVTCLAFNDQTEEAVNLYVSLFKNSRILSLMRSDTDGPVAKGKVLHAAFQLDGQDFMALDGGPYFTFAQGMSLVANCETQEEVDRLWDRLAEGGEPQQCGWVKDKFGVSWQIVPTALGDLMQSGNPEKSKAVFDALMKMVKIDIAALRQAYAQG